MESARHAALQIVRTLRHAGHLAYWVGGCVRDQLLGLDPKDYDVATSATPDQVLGLFPEASLVGASFGVVLAPGGVEIATFRSEMQYRDGRRPEQVHYVTDPALDAARRDFTINALYYDPLEHQVIDLTGGQQDLEQGIIRAIGDPRERFGEDHLRLLRAVRFAARFRYRIEPGTFAAMQEMAPLVRRIAGERLHDEMRRILTGGNLDLVWSYLSESGLWGAMVPSAPDGVRLSRLKPPVGVALGWAALLADVEDPKPIFAFYRFSREEEDQCRDLLMQESWIGSAQQRSLAEQKRFVRKANFGDHLELHRATYGETGAYTFLKGLEQQWGPQDLFPPALLTGGDLIELGLTPGPRFRTILEQLETAQLEGSIRTRDEAVRLALS